MFGSGCAASLIGRARVGAAVASAVLSLGFAVILYAPWYQGPDTFAH